MKPVIDQVLLAMAALSLVGCVGWLTQLRKRPTRAAGLALAFAGMAVLAWFYRAQNTALAIVGGVLVFVGVLIDGAYKVTQKQ